MRHLERRNEAIDHDKGRQAPRVEDTKPAQKEEESHEEMACNVDASPAEVAYDADGKECKYSIACSNDIRSAKG